MNRESFLELLACAGADILADLPHLSDAELFGVYLFLLRAYGT